MSTTRTKWGIRFTFSALLMAGPVSAPALASGDSQTAQPSAQPAQDPARVFGLGGRVGGFGFGIGGSVRVWSKGPLGFQFDVSRYSLSESLLGFGDEFSYSTTQFAPAVLYRFGEDLGNEDVEVQPYAGGGLNIYRTTLSEDIAGIGRASASATDMGLLVVGGAQIFLKRVPKLGISGEVGYYQSGDPFSGLSVGGFATSGAVHWYVR